jgi:hypothetical protein
VAEALVRALVTQVRHCQKAENDLRQLLTAAFADLPSSPHVQVVTIPGIGEATAAVLVAKIVGIDRFATPNQLVNYFGIFPEENSSGVDKQGRPLPPGTLHMSRKGNDLVRSYLWNASRTAIRLNPAVRALYRRQKAKGKRGDVAIGHCMRKLLHLVFAVWKTDRPFDEEHYARRDPQDTPTVSDPGTGATSSTDEGAGGHKRDSPAEGVVTPAPSTVETTPPSVKPAPPPAVARPRIDFAFLRQQVSLERVLAHLGLLEQLRGDGPQRRGPCPVHSHPGDRERTFSVHLGKDASRCFQADCGAQGNALDLWAAIHRLPLYDAALHLAETFGLPRNRVPTALAVLPANRPMPCSKLTDHSSDSESETRLLILVGERANDNFQIDLLAQREVGPTGLREILHQLRTVLG